MSRNSRAPSFPHCRSPSCKTVPLMRSPHTNAFVALLAITLSAIAETPPAFPGVEGAGMFATGGRGGAVVHVTNLNADGPGSLADAVSQSNRIVVFDVSGIIDLSPDDPESRKKGKIVVDHPDITIAGQTAPGEGICIKGGMLEIAAGNVVIRHLRSRRGWIREGDSGDAIGVKPPAVGERQEASGLSTEE